MDWRWVERFVVVVVVDQISGGGYGVRERFGGGGVEDLLGFGDWFYVE